MYRSTHEKFLRAIDQMEFHPTLGRPKEKPEVKTKKINSGKVRTNPNTLSNQEND